MGTINKAFTNAEFLDYLKKKFAHLNDNDAKALEVYNNSINKIKS